jgi:hypothetical protein
LFLLSKRVKNYTLNIVVIFLLFISFYSTRQKKNAPLFKQLPDLVRLKFFTFG